MIKKKRAKKKEGMLKRLVLVLLLLFMIAGFAKADDDKAKKECEEQCPAYATSKYPPGSDGWKLALALCKQNCNKPTPLDWVKNAK